MFPSSQNKPDSMDQILAAVKRLEISVQQNAITTEERLKTLDARLDAFQKFYFELEKQRTVVISNMMTNFVSVTNTVAQLMQPKQVNMDSQMLQYRQQQQMLQQAVLSKYLQQQAPVPDINQEQINNLLSLNQQNPMSTGLPYMQPNFSAQPPVQQSNFPTQPPVQTNFASQSASTVDTSKPPTTVTVAAPVLQTPVKEEVKPELPKAGFGDKFAKKAGEWDCNGCYTRNKPEIEACVSCGTTKDGKAPVANQPFASNTKPTTNASNNSAFSFGIKPAATTTPASPQTPVTKPATNETAKPSFTFNSDKKSSFGGGVSGSLFGGSKPFSQGNTPSFASMANQSNIFSSGGSKNTSFGATTSNTLFKNTTGDNEGGNDEESPEDFVPDAHYEPVVPLPEKIEARTGEEGEDVLFETNCKLYVYVNSEIKERGRGPMRVLYNPSKKSSRIVMRRDQVFKICANFPITNGMTITDKPNRENIGLVNAVDFSEEPEGQRQVFLFKFDNAATYHQFKKLFDDCVNGREQSKAAGTTDKEVNAFKMPVISCDSVEDEDDIDEEEYNNDYEDEEDDEHQVVYEVSCSVQISDQDDVEKYNDVKLVITTTDDMYYKVWFDIEGNDEEYVPHWIDDSLDIKLNQKNSQIYYEAHDEGTDLLKNLTISFKSAAEAKKCYEILKSFQDVYVPYEG